MIKDIEDRSSFERIADALERIADAQEAIEQDINCIIYPDGNSDCYLRAVSALSVKGMQQETYRN